MQTVKRLVSGNKARFKDPELNLELDLVYLTDQPNILLMGFPASGLAAWYRNDRHEVLRFLNSRHGDKYRIYNFVPTWENSYDADFFDGRVSRFPFPDHHAPPLSLISLFVTDISHWLDGDPDRAAAIHCKAGKGRTGSMAISYLLSMPYLPRGPAPINNLIRSSKKSSSKASLHSKPSRSNSTAPASTKPPKIQIDTATASTAAAASTPQSPIDEDDNALATPLSATAESPITPSSAQSGGAPDPEYLFALHTRQRMKPKFSNNTWIPEQLERKTSQVSSLLSKTSSAPHLSRDSAAASSSNGEAAAANGPGLTEDGFDAVVQATAHASGPLGPLNRLANTDTAKNEPSADAAPLTEGTVATHSSSKPEEEEEGEAPAQQPRKYGVSISSQRRFVGYWFRIFHGQDARAPFAEGVQGWTGSPVWGPGLRGKRRARIVEIIVHREQPAKPTTSSKFIDDHIRVHLSRYDDDLVHRLEAEEWRVRTGPDAILSSSSSSSAVSGTEREEAVQRARNFDWGDSGVESRHQKLATFKRPSSSEEEKGAEGGESRTRPLHLLHNSKTSKKSSSGSTTEKQGAGTAVEPDDDDDGAGFILDPDRELLLTVFLSKSHAKLPHVASLASVWLVPAFEDVIQTTNADGEGEGKGRRLLRTSFGKADLDWRKEVGGVDGLEVVWEVLDSA